MNSKLKVGVTGNIGSGKSSVCALIEKKGYPVIYADVLAKSLYPSNKELKDWIISNFGKHIYEGGVFHPSALAEIVFADEMKLHKLNAFVHPLVIEENLRLMDEYLKSADIVFHEAALLFEADMLKYFDKIVVVAASESLAKERVMVSRGITAEEFDNRLTKQLPAEFKIRNADYVIENSGTLAELELKTDALIADLHKHRITV